MVTSLEKLLFASHLRKPKIRNKAHDFPKPITSQTLHTYHFHVPPPRMLSVGRETCMFVSIWLKDRGVEVQNEQAARLIAQHVFSSQRRRNNVAGRPL